MARGELAPRSPRPSAARVWARRLAPWAISAAAIAAILQRYSAREIAAHLAAGHVGPVGPVAIALIVALLPLVAAWDFLVFRGALGGPAYRDVIRGKAGSAVLMSLGYAFGNGGYGVWLARRTGAGAGATAGAMLYVVLSDLAAVCLVATGPAWSAPIDGARSLRFVAPAIAAVAIALLLGAPRVVSSGSGRRAILAAWAAVPASRGALQIAGRCFNITLIVLATWVGARAFGLAIPAAAMATYMPIILLVGSLPVNVAGFGAVQGVWLLAFGAYARGEQILAFNVVWSLLCGAAILMRGLPFVRRVVAEIDEGAAPATPEPGDWALR